MNPIPPAPETGSLEDILAAKKAKVEELRTRGIDPYPPRSRKTHSCAQVQAIGAALSGAEHSAQTVACAGRLLQLRDMGKSVFAHLQDETGRCQLYFKKDALPEAYERLEKLHENKGMLRGLATGFRDLDTMLSGFQKSDLIIIAARPSMGKTTLALDIARMAGVLHEKSVVIFSLEMFNLLKKYLSIKDFRLFLLL